MLESWAKAVESRGDGSEPSLHTNSRQRVAHLFHGKERGAKDRAVAAATGSQVPRHPDSRANRWLLRPSCQAQAKPQAVRGRQAGKQALLGFLVLVPLAEGTGGSSGSLGSLVPQPRQEQAVVMVGLTLEQRSLKTPAGHPLNQGCAHRLSLTRLPCTWAESRPEGLYLNTPWPSSDLHLQAPGSLAPSHAGKKSGHVPPGHGQDHACAGGTASCTPLCVGMGSGQP